jgi:hypothetical protein
MGSSQSAGLGAVRRFTFLEQPLGFQGRPLARQPAIEAEGQGRFLPDQALIEKFSFDELVLTAVKAGGQRALRLN